MRYITEKGLDLMKRFEGFRATPYYCSGNVFTIGFGHAIRQGETFTELTEDEAEELLKKDIGIAERAVIRLTRAPLEDSQFNSLVSFCFNLGSGAYQRSSLRSKLNRSEYLDAGEEFLKWCKAGGKVIRGLLRRRIAEKEMFMEGVF